MCKGHCVCGECLGRTGSSAEASGLGHRDWRTCGNCGRVLREDGTMAEECPGCCGRLADLGGQAAAPGVLASRLLRLAGYLADWGIVGLLTVGALYAAGVVEALTRQGAAPYLAASAWIIVAPAVYYVAPTAVYGRTFGKWLVGTKVVGPDGNVPGWARAIGRGLISFLAKLLAGLWAIGILDPLWLVWDRHRQTLHDKVAGTVVISTRPVRAVPMFIVSVAIAVGVYGGSFLGSVDPSSVIQAQYVPSGSMLPTLRERERLLVNKLSYTYGDLRRGDIIVFLVPPAAFRANPLANPPGQEKEFMMRLVALPGDTIEVRDGRLWLQEPGQEGPQPVEERYLGGSRMDYEWGPHTVPEGHVVVFGDNRKNSNDSSKWCDENGDEAPFLPIENIRGRAVCRYWPLNRFGAIAGGNTPANVLAIAIGLHASTLTEPPACGVTHGQASVPRTVGAPHGSEGAGRHDHSRAAGRTPPPTSDRSRRCSLFAVLSLALATARRPVRLN